MALRLEDLGFPRSAAERLSAAGTLLHLDAGAVLCEEGERGTQAFLLLEGEADVHLADDQVMVGAGDVVGELATLDSPPHGATPPSWPPAPSRCSCTTCATYRALAQVDDLRSRLVPERAAA